MLIPHHFDCCNFEFSLRSGGVMPPASFFVKFVLAIQGCFGGSMQVLRLFVLFMGNMVLEF